jgi:DNA-binding transcriptional MerR regulator
MEKSVDAFRTISEAAEELDVPQHVLRFWETRFSQIRPMKRGGGRRYYRPEDMALLRTIRSLLYGEGYTIRGVQRLLKEQGVRAVMALTATPGEPASHKGVLQSAGALEGHERGQDDGAAAELFAEMTVTLRAALGDIEDARRILRAAQAH